MRAALQEGAGVGCTPDVVDHDQHAPLADDLAKARDGGVEVS